MTASDYYAAYFVANATTSAAAVVAAAATGSTGDGGEDADNEVLVAAPLWFWIMLVCIAAASFWCQAAVTEERFVPALNVIATTFNIPDDGKA